MTEEKTEKNIAEELKERAEQIAAQAGQRTEEAVKEFKEEVEQEARAKKSKGKENTLVPADQYLASGIHIGTQRKIAGMRKFIFKVRTDGLAVLDVATIDRRLRIVSSFLAQFAPEKIIVVAGRDVGKKPAQKFCELTGSKAIITRFMPGSLTNPSIDSYIEPDLVFVVDPSSDRQAILESLKMNIPIIALCDTNNMTQNIDLVLPVNNKGKKSLALVFWILAREVLKLRGKISSSEEFQERVEDFEAVEVKEAKSEKKSK